MSDNPDLQKSGLHSAATIKICQEHRDSTIAWIEDLEKQLEELRPRAREKECGRV